MGHRSWSMIETVYIRAKGWYNIIMKESTASLAGAMTQMVERIKGPSKLLGLVILDVLNIVGQLMFLALTFVFFYVLGIVCIMIGFMRANRRGGGK